MLTNQERNLLEKTQTRLYKNLKHLRATNNLTAVYTANVLADIDELLAQDTAETCEEETNEVN